MPGRGNYPRKNDTDRNQYIVDSIRAGKTFKEVGKTLGLTRQRIHMIFQEATNGEKPPKRDRHIYKWTPEMIDLLGTMTDAAVARQLHIGVGTIGDKRRGLGIPRFLLPGPSVNRIGETHDRLTILAWKRAQGRLWWICECNCGKITWVQSCNIDKTRSCGCLLREHSSRLGKSRRKIPVDTLIPSY